MICVCGTNSPTEHVPGGKLAGRQASAVTNRRVWPTCTSGRIHHERATIIIIQIVVELLLSWTNDLLDKGEIYSIDPHQHLKQECTAAREIDRLV